MNRCQRLRRVLATGMVVAGVGLLVAPPVVAQDQVRTQTDLLGYDLQATAAPLTVRIFENFIPIPADPGEPQMEITTSHTSARLGSGPSGRAVASSVWPGPTVGDGFGQLTGDESQQYPVRATARYPGSGEEDWQGSQTVPGVDGFGMTASARGLDISAFAEGGGIPGPAEALAAYGQVRSESHATVEDGQAVTNAIASISEVRLLDGTIVLKGISTNLTATSDGSEAATSGRTSVGEIEVLGQPIRLTDQGAEVAPTSEDEETEGEGEGDGNPLGGALDPVNQIVQRLTDDLVADGLEKTLGITIEALDHEQTIDGTIGKRTAGGVRITVDVQVLRDYLTPILDTVPLNDVISTLPQDLNDLKGLMFEVLGLGPKLEFVVGRGVVSASASPPFEVSAPSAPPAPPPPPTTASGGTSLPGTSTSVSSPVTSNPGQAPQASVAPPATTPETPALAASEPPPIFQGIPMALAALTLFLAAVPTYGLTNLRDHAVGAGASLDPPRQLPDLRGGA